MSTPGHHPRTVWVLGFVSLLMDLSSELVHSLLAVFLVCTLSASMLAVGLIKGIAEATGLIVKFSGAHQRFHRPAQGLAAAGLAALTRPLFPLAISAEMVFTARFLDAPRDALLVNVTSPETREASGNPHDTHLHAASAPRCRRFQSYALAASCPMPIGSPPPYVELPLSWSS
ncbi:MULTISPECIES: hypothetical protein [unclassified Variovorax]|uniref:hypothetical protein n=1 Tax=unclassified Variovorax TaxID=663243 RepID=UPI00076CA00E|nr:MULTISPECIES: hypothetical protein [unclassified Variovorax]KWT81211.1 Permeases of the major facilitator superfamily [Variovorax sp. WDL1]PNG48919.1 hypothetical protein CHC07_06709 [Variovorax sp. B4]PNG49775.1 hypothetical protein CHC06_05356 [Variovorax sp. B2]PNG50622.1 hypothetical protein CHC06_06246 [Variovorax sp. B2]VTV17815.1 hypothetical protein WDL1P1_00681 [Variovorax sp. WDL1]